MKIIKKILRGLLIVVIFFVAVFFIYALLVTSEVSLNHEKLSASNVTVQILDDNDALLSGANSTLNEATYDTFPAHLIQAFLATEDRQFFTHNGFNFKRMIGAFLKNVSAMSMKEGASTISQQLIKNTHLSGEKTIKRKLQEIKLTIQLEKKYSKEDIFTKYLNSIYFGHNVFGINEAARFYFNRTVDDLSIEESALLAGLVKSPNNYSPFKHPQKCLERRNAVLKFMYDESYIDEHTLKKAKNTPLPTQQGNRIDELSYCQYVYDELEEIFNKRGIDFSGNVVVRTYLNQDCQKHLTQELSRMDTQKIGGILDNSSGGFIAFYSTCGNVKRSPASTIKPLAVYAPAIQENLLSPATPILDEEINFSGYSPKNYDGTYHGYVSARESLAKSLNVPAVKILNSLTVKKSKAYLEKMRLPLQKEDEHLALALGAVNDGFTLPQLLSAYSTFPNGGQFREGAFIKSVTLNGRTIYLHNHKSERVFDESTAFLTTSMLEDSVKLGTAKKLRRLPFSIAAKTGTNGSREKNTDAYAIAYSSGLTAGVWSGNLDNSKITHTGGGLPCEILANIFAYLYSNYNKTYFLDFPLPTSVESVNLDLLSYKNNQELLLAGALTPKEYCFQDFFKKDNTPTQFSPLFNIPSIPTPRLEYENQIVKIIFDENSPSFYQYEIKKEVDNHTEILYFGDKINEFIDEELQADKHYIYTVTPYFNTIRGQTITLPCLSTKT